MISAANPESRREQERASGDGNGKSVQQDDRPAQWRQRTRGLSDELIGGGNAIYSGVDQ
jgi:hypothetical protein